MSAGVDFDEQPALSEAPASRANRATDASRRDDGKARVIEHFGGISGRRRGWGRRRRRGEIGERQTFGQCGPTADDPIPGVRTGSMTVRGQAASRSPLEPLGDRCWSLLRSPAMLPDSGVRIARPWKVYEARHADSQLVLAARGVRAGRGSLLPIFH